MRLDGKEALKEANRDSDRIFLRKGPHFIGLYFQKLSGTDTALTLLWQKPGDLKYEVVPYSALSH